MATNRDEHPTEFGHDSLGEFIVLGITFRRKSCGICGKTGTSIRYEDTPKVSTYAAKARSLLIRNKRTKNFIRTIGITCGCYAKVHRQIAHIESGKKGTK